MHYPHPCEQTFTGNNGEQIYFFGTEFTDAMTTLALDQ